MATSVNNMAATFSSCNISAKHSSSSKPTSISLPMTTTSMSSGALSSPSVAWNPQATLPRSLKSAFVGLYGGPGPKAKSLNPTLNPNRRRTPKPHRSIKSEISVGDKLPEATFSYIDKEDNLLTITVSDLTRGKKVVLVAVPGAFTPTCSQKHLPGFVQRADELKSKGIDTIACISVNDAFVMKAWGENLDVDDKVLLLADGNGYFTKAMGVALDLSDKPAGLGVRSKRYALVAEDGIVKILKLEEGGAFTVSGAEEILESL